MPMGFWYACMAAPADMKDVPPLEGGCATEELAVGRLSVGGLCVEASVVYVASEGWLTLEIEINNYCITSYRCGELLQNITETPTITAKRHSNVKNYCKNVIHRNNVRDTDSHLK